MHSPPRGYQPRALRYLSYCPVCRWSDLHRHTLSGPGFSNLDVCCFVTAADLVHQDLGVEVCALVRIAARLNREEASLSTSMRPAPVFSEVIALIPSSSPATLRVSRDRLG